MGSSKKYKAPPVQAPIVAATPPDPEQVAQAPEVNKESQLKQATNAKRKGSAALRIQLNVGGLGGKGGGNGLSI